VDLADLLGEAEQCRTFVVVKVEFGSTGAGEHSKAGAAMRRSRWVLGVLVLGLSGALVGVVPDEVSAVAARTRCRATALVANDGSGTVSTIDVKTKTKNPTDITIGRAPIGVAVTPDGKTAFITDGLTGTVSTIDMKTRTVNPTDIAVGSLAFWVAVTPDGKAAFVTNNASGTVSTIDVKTKTKNPTDITVGPNPKGVAVTPDGKTAFVTHANFGTEPVPNGNSVSMIDVRTRTKNPNDITVGAQPVGVAVTPDGKTAFVTNNASGTVSTIDVKTRTKNPNDIAVGMQPGVVTVTPCRR
jgi:YVTN family beta-propeller protein